MEATTTESIWRSLSDDLRRFIRRRVADDHAAEDLLQETFVRVHRHLATVEDPRRLAAWVYRIARNVVHDHHRQASAAAGSLTGVEPTVPASAHRPPRCGQEARWLREMIQTLPPPYREATWLAEVDGHAQREIATRLGLSLSGAKSRVQRGRAMLREALEQCCRFDFDARGNVIDVTPRPERKVCRDCET